MGEAVNFVEIPRIPLKINVVIKSFTCLTDVDRLGQTCTVYSNRHSRRKMNRFMVFSFLPREAVIIDAIDFCVHVRICTIYSSLIVIFKLYVSRNCC